RQRHQDALDPAAGLQPEERAAVVQQVELDVPAAAEQLEPPLPLRVRQRLAAADDRQVRVQERLAGVADKGERLFEIALDVIEEDAADAARLVAVRQKE